MTFATDSPQSKRFAFITSDNVQEGYAAADALAKAIGGKGELAATENPGQLNHEIRIRSFKERIAANWPNVKVVTTLRDQPGHGQGQQRPADRPAGTPEREGRVHS